jgi:hypothetical protein
VSLDLKPGEYQASRRDLERTVPCSGCGARMAWIETAAGKRMPLSSATARPLPCPDCPGQGARCRTCFSTGTLYAVLNHWADCPARARFKRPKAPPSTGEPSPE